MPGNHVQNPSEDYRQDEHAGSLDHLQSLFRQPGGAPDKDEEDDSSNGEHPLQRKSTRKQSNRTATRTSTEETALLGDHNTRTSQQFSSLSYSTPGLNEIFQRTSISEKTPKAGPSGRKTTKSLGAGKFNANFSEVNTSHRVSEKKNSPRPSATESPKDFVKEAASELFNPSTYVGSFMFLLYHIVFCLASGSAIQRPHAKNSLLGLMTKMAALGIMFASPVYYINIGNGIPSLYATCDLFLAPLLASIAKIIDEDLAEDSSLSDEENDEIFLATFGLLTFVGMFLSGIFLVLAGVYKLANLGSFLPFPVLCGFFVSVGIMTWHLGFCVDTSGKSFHSVFFSGDSRLILYALMHHIPGVIVASIMKYVAPKNPFYPVVVLFGTILSVYIVMFASGTSLDEARDMGWFWHHEEIVYERVSASIGFKKWLPPAPFGVWASMSKVHWASVSKALQPACALSFLYLIRCTLHSAALLKNVSSLARHIKVDKDEEHPLPMSGSHVPRKKTRMEMFSEMVDIEEVMSNVTGHTNPESAMEVEKAKPTSWTLQGVTIQYGLAQLVSAVVGGFGGVIPSVATSHAMFALKAERVAPQLGSVLLLAIFYLTDFRLIAFVPKIAFSCLLTLAFIDIIFTWMIMSYLKTKEKLEWLVVPVIVFFAFSVGLLQAVFLGIAISTFLFVAAFFRSGVVKFAASGLTVRSTIERPTASAQTLDEHGDLIQVLILQNYLFFGNASSVLSYITSMFEDPDEDDDDDDLALPPLPKFVILDMALVSGMDTSCVSIVSDILNLCSKNDCKLFLSGMSVNLRSVLAHAGVKPLKGERKERPLRFFSAMDTALGKAEDMTLELLSQGKPKSTRKLLALGEENGFQIALRHIDDQHGTSFAAELSVLEENTVPVELEPDENLYESASRPERGLFFIEEGVLKIERDSSLTANTMSLRSRGANQLRGGGSVSEFRLRSGSIGRDYARLKAISANQHQQTFRLARVGPGWIVGAVEAVSGMEKSGAHIAVTSCRLHYLSFTTMEELGETKPSVMLNLYKLLSNMMAKQQELQIGQLATLHTIMAAPAQQKPIGRKAAVMFMNIT